jgi:hypothetical protein
MRYSLDQSFLFKIAELSMGGAERQLIIISAALVRLLCLALFDGEASLGRPSIYYGPRRSQLVSLRC